jgi:hypothetical protein
MAYRNDPVSMEYDDDELLDRMTAEYEPPSHPPGLQFQIGEEDLEKAAGAGGSPGDSLRFSAMACVTSVFRGTDSARIELEVEQFAGEDGKFFELSRPASICLCDPELEKLGLDDDAELGDMLHLIGEARVESISRNEFVGECATLQVTHLTFEDESEESREG